MSDVTPQTPMVEQYLSVKEQHNDSLVFFRLGDFYELFFEDAEIVSKELGLVLTKRVNMPMCGIPHHAYETYVSRLINNGHKIAICEQLETTEEAQKRGGKTTIRRGVTRVITKGTIVESSLINDSQNHFLLAVVKSKNIFGLAYTDISTGMFKLEKSTMDNLLTCIARINPVEIICPDILLNDPVILECFRNYRSIVRPISSINASNCSKKLAEFYSVNSVDVFGSLPNECIEAAAAIVDYIGIAHIGANTKLDFPKMIDSGEYIQIDYFTKKSLELNKSLGDNKKSTLLNTIDKTMTAQGSRLLSEWLANPLSNVEKINKRLSFVEFFVANKDLTKTIRSHLSKIPDLERALSRICMNRSCPRDLGIIRNALIEIHCLNNIICSIPDLATLDTSFSTCQAIIKSLEDALNEINLPLSANDGNFIKDGYDRELDEQRGFVKNSTRTIVSLQQKYVAQTGIYNLKVKKNGVLGYFIETTVNNASRIPYEFVHKQTLASCIRYVTKELIDIANATYSSEGSSKARELLVFDKLREMVCMSYEHIKSASQKISFVDCISALAALAIENNYVKPQIVVEKIIDIENGRHPVVEERLKQDGSHFVSNDCSMNENSVIAIITGPNMGGKSTYLRQNAIIIIMAQIGSYVPASKAVIGVVDKIFSRVGASDDISAGKSTFMVEMVETSIILRQATDRSFVILDEVGRGTSTYDGLAIAWAILLEIHDNIKARTLFATHYHELKKISDDNRNVKFLTVLVEENNQDIVFLYKIANGFADKSYGLHVASIAGFPKHVIAQAKMLLEEMTK